MTYKEAEELASQHIDQFRSEPFFKFNGVESRFLAFIIAPIASSLSTKQAIYIQCVKDGRDNKNLLIDLGLWGKEQSLFFIYQQGGHEIIIPFESYLTASNNEL